MKNHKPPDVFYISFCFDLSNCTREHGYFHMFLDDTREKIYSNFSSNSEAFASELLENLRRNVSSICYTHSDIHVQIFNYTIVC